VSFSEDVLPGGFRKRRFSIGWSSSTSPSFWRRSRQAIEGADCQRSFRRSSRRTWDAASLSGLPAVIGFTVGGPPWLTLLVGVVWGITAIADSAQFSTAMTELSPPAYVGTALTTQTCAGFALTMVSIWLVPPVVRVVGWSWAVAILALGPLFGVISMARLRALPESVRMAGGRR